MVEYCQSCGMPLNNPEVRGLTKVYCRYCTDSEGRLRPYKEIQRGIADWLKSWQPDLDDIQALARAASYMQAMPAWAEPKS